MRALIAYWQAKLNVARWLMSTEDRAMIAATIQALREAQKERVTAGVQREADLVRTVKQLSTSAPAEVKHDKTT